MTLIVPTHDGEFTGFGDQFQRIRQKARKVGPGRWGVLDHIQVIEDEQVAKPKLIDYKGAVVAEGHDIFGHLKEMASSPVAVATR